MKKFMFGVGLSLTGAVFSASTVMGDAIIYEGFNDLSDTTLGGNLAGTGLDGNWSAEAFLESTSLSYGSLVTSGGKAVNNPGSEFDNNNASPGTTLTDAELLDDGATLWFSVLIYNHPDNPNAANPNNENRTYVALGTGGADGFDRVGGNSGSGFTIAVSKVSEGGVTAQAWNDGSDGGGGASRGATESVALDSVIFAVGKITWGEFGVEDDVFELYLPGTDLVLPNDPISVIAADFDQLGTTAQTINATSTAADNAFDTISFAGGRARNDVPEVDEIRFGASYADVAPVPEPGSLALIGIGGLLIARRRRG